MKAKLRPDLWQRVRQRINRWSGYPAVEMTGRCLGALAAGFVLAGINMADTALPLALCLAAALGLGLPSFAAYAGGCAGYVVFWGAAAALEPMAAGLLLEASLCIFGEQAEPPLKWFEACCCMAFSALVGFLFLLEQRFAARLVWRFLLRVAVAGAGTLCFRAALAETSRLCRLVLLTCLCGGLCAIRPLQIPLGLILACALGAAALETPMALTMAGLCGLALDLCWGEAWATAVLMLAALLCTGGHRLLRLAAWLGAVLLGVLLTGSSSLLLAGAILGAPLSQLLPAERLFGMLPEVRTRQDQRLRVASGLLDQLRQCLTPVRIAKADPETAAVFDRAAERVCRMCSLWDQCWCEQAQETCEALERAAPAMMTRGKAVREDLPALFVNRCRHLEGFLTAVNRELDDLSCRRQYRSRIRESREILARQYGVLSQALGREPVEGDPVCRFRAEIGFRSQGRREESVSGDRGATFRIGKFFYLLLCDGMGTGQAAAAEAGAAIHILRTLLQAGTEPLEAMELLNGIYVLRDDGGFATIDLLQADLMTGEGVLLKWGAAPSYLKRKSGVEKLGAASMPPGLGVGEECRAQVTRLSLARGEQLVLVSDGAGGEEAERFLRQSSGLTAKELASGVISCSQNSADDDRTAAVVILRARVPA